MTTIQPGEFWVADILFTNGVMSKKRPVLILWVDGDDAVCAVVTSARPRSQTDILLKDWRKSGLKIASTVRPLRLDCFEKSLLISRIDQVSEADATVIKSTWRDLIQPQF